MYGYRQVNGRLEIVPEQAEIIRLAADLYLEGYGRYKLEDALPLQISRAGMGPAWAEIPLLT